MDSKTLPIINTPRLALRWISADDIDSLYEIFSDPQVMRYWSTVPLPNREAAAELQREIAQGNESKRMFKWGVALRDPGTVIGTATHVPFSGARTGKTAVAEFFAIGHYRARTRATGRTFDSPFAMVFTFRNGKVAAFREFTDSAAINAAFA